MRSPWFQTAVPEAPQLAMKALRLVTAEALMFLAWVTWDRPRWGEFRP
jgi:hypothetical protein